MNAEPLDAVLRRVGPQLEETLKRMGATGARLKQLQHERGDVPDDPWQESITALTIASGAAVALLSEIVDALIVHAVPRR